MPEVVLECGQYSEEFGVGVHQGSVLSPLYFIPVLEALSQEFHTGVFCELLYADDLAVISDTLEECITNLKHGRIVWRTEHEIQHEENKIHELRCWTSYVM